MKSRSATFSLRDLDQLRIKLPFVLDFAVVMLKRRSAHPGQDFLPLQFRAREFTDHVHIRRAGDLVLGERHDARIKTPRLRSVHVTIKRRFAKLLVGSPPISRISRSFFMVSSMAASIAGWACPFRSLRRGAAGSAPFFSAREACFSLNCARRLHLLIRNS